MTIMSLNVKLNKSYGLMNIEKYRVTKISTEFRNLSKILLANTSLDIAFIQSWIFKSLSSATATANAANTNIDI